MSMKSIESVVRELQQTVVTLVNKVGSLECKITEQSAIIIKLSGSSTRNSYAANAPSQTPSTAATTADATRPVRTARVHAAAAIAKLSSAATKRRNGRADTAVTPKSDIATINIPDKLKLTCGEENTLPKLTTADVIHSDVITATVEVTKRDDDKTESQWQVVNNRRRRKQQAPVIVGTAVSNDEIQVAEQVRHIQAWCFKPDTTTATVLSFLKKIIDSDFTVVKREIKSERHASFLIGMPGRVFDIVTSPTAWPAGVRFTEWFLYRPRVQRGAASGPHPTAGARTSSGSSA